jgi:hypothetical protein
MKRISWIILLFASFTCVHAASFDCQMANTNIEKLICSNAVLSKLDEDLDKVFKQTFEIEVLKQEVVVSQKQWLKNVRNVCKDMACIQWAYKGRIRELALSMLTRKKNQAGLNEMGKSLILGNWSGGSRAFDGFNIEILESTALLGDGEWAYPYSILKFEEGVGATRTEPWSKGKWRRVSIWIDSAIYEVLEFTLREGSKCAAGIELYVNAEDYIINSESGGRGWGIWEKDECANP